MEETRIAGVFGRQPKVHDDRNLQFKTYAKPTLAVPPQTHSSLQDFYQSLGALPAQASSYFPMDGNDRAGCCTVAARAHMITLFAGMIGQSIIQDTNSVIEQYFTLSGGRDDGLPCLDVLKDWLHNAPVASQQILGFVEVDVGNQEEVKQAISLFGAVYVGFNVQRDAQSDFASHKPWTPGPLIPNAGHAVALPDYTTQGGDSAFTWGGLQAWTWPWFHTCVAEAYVVVPAQAITPGFNPNWDYKQLREDFMALGGGALPAPIDPEPAPTPDPNVYDVGGRVAAAMRARGDTPATNEDYPRRVDGTGSGYSVTFGKSGAKYEYIQSIDRVAITKPDELY